MGGECADGTGGGRVGAVEDVGRGPEPVDPDACGPGPDRLGRATPPVATAQRMVPVGWAARPAVEPDRAEPTDGRHAFDRDAALTPIFTALRRGGRRRLRPGSPPLRLAPEPVERPRADPPTSPIPVVPALHALDPYPTGGLLRGVRRPVPDGGAPQCGRPGSRRPLRRGAGRAPGRPPPPSSNETTAVWRPVRRPGGLLARDPSDTGRHHRRLAPAGWYASRHVRSASPRLRHGESAVPAPIST